MEKCRVLVTRKLPILVEKRLRDKYSVTFNESDVPLTFDELSAGVRDYDALVTTVSDKISESILRSPNSRIKMIANVGVGYNNIDVKVAQHLGIVVSNTPDVLTEATADIAMFLILAATRKVFAYEQMLRKNEWKGFSIVDGLGAGIQGKMLGIIGMGRIGQATARRAALGFGMKIVYFNRSQVGELDFDAQRLTTITEVMSSADVVSIHVPGGGSNPLIKSEHINAMKPTAFFVNTSRGDSIEQDALISALHSNKIAGAGLDVFLNEPSVPEILRNMNNVTLLPHIGSATQEVRLAMGMLAVENLTAFFEGQDPPNRIN